MEEVAEDELCADEDDAEFEPELVGGEAGAEERGETDGVADSEAEEDGPEDVLYLREGDVTRAEVVAEGLNSLTREANAEEERGAGNKRGELPPERAGSRGIQRQRDGVGGHFVGAALPADMRDEVEPDERGECECDDDGGGVNVEGKFGGRARVHEVLLRCDVGGVRGCRRVEIENPRWSSDVAWVLGLGCGSVGELRDQARKTPAQQRMRQHMQQSATVRISLMCMRLLVLEGKVKVRQQSVAG